MGSITERAVERLTTATDVQGLISFGNELMGAFSRPFMGTITQPIGALSTNTEPIFLTLLDFHCMRHDVLLYN
jgi:hypothetical protein